MRENGPSIDSEVSTADHGSCPHGNSPYSCPECGSSEEFLRSVGSGTESGLIRGADVALDDHERSILKTIDWNVPGEGEQNGGAGFFATGPMSDREREAAIADAVVRGFERGGAIVQLVSADSLLTDPSALGIVDRVLNIGHVKGARLDGNPRVMIVTGFSQSPRLTEEGIRKAIDRIVGRRIDSEGLERIMKSPDKDSAAVSGSQEETEINWAMLLARRFVANGTWQAVAKRKNTPRETIYLMTVAPNEIFDLVNAFQSGDPLHRSDMVARWQEDIFVPPPR